MGALHRLCERFAGEVAFFVVYIREAHPEDGWVVSDNRTEDIRVIEPTTAQERAAVATTCMVRGAIEIPVLLDGMDNAVASAYGAWPDRLYLIGTDGRVAFQGGMGPFGFLPDELEAAIVAETQTA